MEISVKIARLARELSRASVLIEEHQRHIAYKDLGEFRAKTESHNSKAAVDEALDLFGMAERQKKTLEGLCQDLYGVTIDVLRERITEGNAVVTLFQEDLTEYFKIKKTYDILVAADAFDKTGEFPEESRETYEDSLHFIERRLTELSDDAESIIPIHQTEE